MYIETVAIENLRTFKRSYLEFLHSDKKGAPTRSGRFRNINLLLGNNGLGKSTLLRAIALASTAPLIADSGYVPYAMVRRDPSRRAGKKIAEASVVADFLLHDQDLSPDVDSPTTLKHQTRITIEKRRDIERVRPDSSLIENSIWEGMFQDDSPAFLVLGYGATRRVETPENYDPSSRRRMTLRYSRVAGLFEESFSLIPLERWLPELKSGNPGRYTQVVHLVDKLIERPVRFDGHYEDHQYFFKQGKSIVPFSAMSDGYRSYIGWITDLLYHISMGCPSGKKLVENRGIVLVDEVDLHLHPSWQLKVLPTIAKSLPLLQFIVTSHSPIVTGSLHAENIWVMEKQRGESHPVRLGHSVHGLNADQVLVSEYFGLETTRAPGAQRKMRELNLRALEGDESASLELLRKLASGLEDDPTAQSTSEDIFFKTPRRKKA